MIKSQFLLYLLSDFYQALFRGFSKNTFSIYHGIRTACTHPTKRKAICFKYRDLRILRFKYRFQVKFCYCITFTYFNNNNANGTLGPLYSYSPDILLYHPTPKKPKKISDSFYHLSSNKDRAASFNLIRSRLYILFSAFISNTL